MHNVITVIGHVGNHIDIKELSNGTSCINFSVATKDKTGEDATVQWHRVVKWNPDEYFSTIKTGDLVMIVGKYVSRKIQHVNGGDIHDFRIVADKTLILKPKIK